MRNSTVSRNYAAALLELAVRHGEGDAYAAAFRDLDRALGDARVARFLETPKVERRVKEEVVRSALEGRVPELFLHFVLVVIRHQRQSLLGDIRREYEMLLDERAGRINAQVTVARRPDEATIELIGTRLSELLDSRVVPHIQVDPALIGGFVARFGDRVIDGSVRRRLVSLRREMMQTALPAVPAASA